MLFVAIPCSAAKDASGGGAMYAVLRDPGGGAVGPERELASLDDVRDGNGLVEGSRRLVVSFLEIVEFRVNLWEGPGTGTKTLRLLIPICARWLAPSLSSSSSSSSAVSLVDDADVDADASVVNPDMPVGRGVLFERDGTSLVCNGTVLSNAPARPWTSKTPVSGNVLFRPATDEESERDTEAEDSEVVLVRMDDPSSNVVSAVGLVGTLDTTGLDTVRIRLREPPRWARGVLRVISKVLSPSSSSSSPSFSISTGTI
jgi:hypothetical protein